MVCLYMYGLGNSTYMEVWPCWSGRVPVGVGVVLLEWACPVDVGVVLLEWVWPCWSGQQGALDILAMRASDLSAVR